MGDGDGFGSFWSAKARGDFMHGMKNVRGIIAIPADVADSNGDVFENNEAGFMLEHFTIERTGLDCSLAIFTWISVHRGSFH
jgi:hypothetical protein